MPIETVTEARMPGIGRPVARGYIDHLNETHRKRSVRGRAQAASAGGVDRLPVPGQEFGDAPGRVVGNASEHVGEVMLCVETVELGAFDQ